MPATRPDRDAPGRAVHPLPEGQVGEEGTSHRVAEAPGRLLSAPVGPAGAAAGPACGCGRPCGRSGRSGVALGLRHAVEREASPTGSVWWGTLPLVQDDSWRIPTRALVNGCCPVTGVSLRGTPLGPAGHRRQPRPRQAGLTGAAQAPTSVPDMRTGSRPKGHGSTRGARVGCDGGSFPAGAKRRLGDSPAREAVRQVPAVRHSTTRVCAVTGTRPGREVPGCDAGTEGPARV
jgi:hypothetical protein